NWIAETLRTERLLLVFDDFERNLETGGQRFLSPETCSLLSAWVNSPLKREGRLLVTCRYPLQDVPGLEKVRECLLDVALDPLSPAEIGKLYQRLPALRTLPNEERAKLGRTVGGHPRMLEFVNALLTPRKGEVDEEAKGRRRRVWQQMEELAGPAGVALEVAGGLSREEATERAIRLGMRNICLRELVKLAERTGDAQVLFQTAISNLPVSAAGVAHMLAGQPTADDE
ncbi:MAG: hypothetical protein ACKOJF_31765, partial [Planctomycetaceae bacterium]